ncbi:hypothetical protein EJB05_33053 [Eragrostis curvula]|uniref:B box-type domain-containing protein n=1 Tax=Eragrostis curvula TaxID=38414 RepID=A0A5J9U071_9POAL|nr:hypothetical protein EJB05_33053 [Eragrostis curvula]
MKVLCSACEAAEASVLCCADDAALCARCDREVHAANRLAGKHQRLPLLAPGGGSGAAAASAADVAPPRCDICQECDAYFFCLEDRALLCRSCDVAVHTANDLVSAHRRFLLTGVQVGQDQQGDDDQPQPEPEPSPRPQAKSIPAPFHGGFSWAPDAAGSLPEWPSAVMSEQFGSPAPRHAAEAKQQRGPALFGGRVAGGVMDWPLGEFFRGVSDFAGGYGFGDTGNSKADSGKLGGSAGGSPYYRSSSEDRDADDFFGQVPEMQWSVPELPSPPTASGLHCQNAAFVPDISSPETSLRWFPAGATNKRRKKC